MSNVTPSPQTTSLNRQIFALALPALGSLAADPLVTLVDTAFVGRLGAVPLGALGVNAALFSLSFFVFNFLAYGTTPLIGRAVGRGDTTAAGRIVVQALMLALLLGAGSLIILQLLARPLLGAMGASGELLPPALVYLRIRALAGPAVLLITAANGVFRGFQDTRTPLWITLWVSAINLLLDPLFIFGWGWGIAGAAWATLIAQWVGALWFVALLVGKNKQAFGVRLELPRLSELRPFLKIGWELGVRTLSLVLTFTLATAIATRLGVLEVAVHQVLFQLWLFMALVIDALAIAAQALVARYMGEANEQRARQVANRLLFFGVLLGAGLGALFWLLRPVLPQLFTSDSAVIAMTTTIYPFVAFTQILNAIVFVFDGIFIGAEKFGYLALAMLGSSLGTVILLLLVIPLGWGLAGIWWALTLLMFTRLLTLAARYTLKGLT